MDQQPQQPRVVLRKRAPYTCRHKSAAGALDHYNEPLRDGDGSLCPAHAGEPQASPEAPGLKPLIREAAAHELPIKQPHWPFWPGAEAPNAPQAAASLLDGLDAGRRETVAQVMAELALDLGMEATR